MKTLAAFALLLVLSTPAVAKEGISISLNSDDSRTELGPRRDVRDARAAISTKDGSVVLMLIDDVVAMQLTDATLDRMESETKKKNKDTNFFEELVLAGVHRDPGERHGRAAGLRARGRHALRQRSAREAVMWSAATRVAALAPRPHA
jgi:hypothetical protein